MKKNNLEKGSITVFVLTTMLFFLILSITVFTSYMSRKDSQTKEVNQLQKSYNIENDMDEVYQKVHEKYVINE